VISVPILAKGRNEYDELERDNLDQDRQLAPDNMTSSNDVVAPRYRSNEIQQETVPLSVSSSIPYEYVSFMSA
jgi:hypothetical protein